MCVLKIKSILLKENMLLILVKLLNVIAKKVVEFERLAEFLMFKIFVSKIVVVDEGLGDDLEIVIMLRIVLIRIMMVKKMILFKLK